MASFGAIGDRVHRSASANSSPAMGTTPVTPVTVIGMACRLPGGIVKHPRFHAHLVTCDRCALRPGVERSTRPRLLPVDAARGGA